MNGYPNTARELHWDNVAPRVGFAYLVTPKTVVRAGLRDCVHRPVGDHDAVYDAAVPVHPERAAEDAGQRECGVRSCRTGRTVAPIPLTPDAGLGQSVYTADRSAGSGYVEQWNLAVQRAITQNLSVEVAYVGSHIVHVGIPDSNLNQLTVDATGRRAHALLKKVPNPYYGQMPMSSSIGGKTVSGGAVAEAVSAIPERGDLPAQQRHDELQRVRSEGGAAD